MIKKAFVLFTVALLLLSLVSCENGKTVKYIDGSYMNEDLLVGYNFFPSGEGFQFISDKAFPMKYKIKDGSITITTLTDLKVTETFSFVQHSESVIIGGVIYVLVKDDTPSGAIPYK